MHDIRGLTRGRHGITGARLRRPITASLLAIGAGHRAIGVRGGQDGRLGQRPAGLPERQPSGPGAGQRPARPDDAAGEDRPDGADRAEPGHRHDQRLHQPGRVQPAQPHLRAEDLRGRPRRLDPGRRDRHPDRHHRQGRPGQHRPGLGHRVQHHAELRDRSTRGCTSRSSSASTPCTASATRSRRRCSRSRSGWAPPGIPSAAQAGGAVTANALRATGWNWDFAPVQDMARDNRWGRYYETWSEEPALAAAMGAANVRGMQSGGAGGLKVTATVKHFAGYSESINGHDRVQAELPHPLPAGHCSCRRTRARSTRVRARSWWTPARSTGFPRPRRTTC